MNPPPRIPGRPPAARRRLLASVVASVAIPGLARAASAPSISVKLLDGRDFSTERCLGKVLFVNFWATWCAPCRAEMPEIDAYYQTHRDQGLVVLALSTDELADEPKVREAAKPFTFDVAMLKAARLSGFGRIWRMPVSAVIDRRGKLVRQDWFVEPKLDASALDAVIKPLL
ncbi:MAG TPA: TlpA disulfide reductase family protein [Burkholderiaceae bacterium]|nr:TlpA disulfide reductase family protein [Burkholderiaceae bacterium]